jgi:hypothetical protein
MRNSNASIPSADSAAIAAAANFSVTRAAAISEPGGARLNLGTSATGR